MEGETEEELVARIVEDDDQRAKEELFRAYGGVLGSLAYRYSSPLLPYNDAFQVAALGLLKALQRYDGGKGVAFKSFAFPYIEGELKKFYRDKAEMVRLPRKLQKLKREVVLYEERFLQRTGREPVVSQVASHIGADEEDVIEALSAMHHLAPLSIDWCGKNGGEQPPLADVLGECDASFEELETSLLLGDALGSLPRRLRRIAELRLKEGWTQKMIAEEMGISQMHVSRLQNEAMRKLGEFCFADELSA
ncbi:MAG: sigma-70 family RNA polymerase sigma factor [Actinomycetota bacterium]